jgi:hypothetical protein
MDYYNYPCSFIFLKFASNKRVHVASKKMRMEHERMFNLSQSNKM